jgi:hypothetical protein
MDDDEQGRSLISFPYLAGAVEGWTGDGNKKRDALLGWSLGPGRGVRTNGLPAHNITEIIMYP